MHSPTVPNPSTALDIVIIGGSLSGLFAGIALKDLPQINSITILERLREEQLQDLGAGIRCNEEVNDAISELLGIGPESYAAFVDVYRQFDSSGKPLSKVDTGTWTTTWGQLYRVLKGGFEGEIGNWTEGTGVSADGASSRTRSLVLPQIERTVASYLLYRGVVDPIDLSSSTMALYHRAAHFSWPANDTGQFVTYVVPGTMDRPQDSTHCVNWAWYCNKSLEATTQLMTDKDGKTHQYTLPRGKMSDAEVQRLRKDARQTLPEIHAEVVEKTKQPFVQLVTDSLATSNCLWDGKLLLVGDAVGGQRPHAASALMQGIYHGLLLRKLFQNEITLEQWTSQTRSLTQILVEAGQELGEILMHEVLPPREKIPLYMASFMSTQEKLNEIWRRTIGIGDAKVKI